MRFWRKLGHRETEAMRPSGSSLHGIAVIGPSQKGTSTKEKNRFLREMRGAWSFDG